MTRKPAHARCLATVDTGTQAAVSSKKIIAASRPLLPGETPMPNFRPSPDLDMHYEIDDFTDPWRRPAETVLMLHGNAESGLAWWAWAPTVARQYRVVRPDMRGFGESTPMPRDYPWTLDRLVE